MRVAVFIPILGGPALIHEIMPRYQLTANRVQLIDDFIGQAAMADRYTHLTAREGPLSGFLDPDIPAYELTIDEVPEEGRSWELPVALAHWLQAQGHEIVTEAPDLVVWTTGSIKPDGAIRSGSYHVAAKLKESRPRLEKIGDGLQVYLLPYGQDADCISDQERVVISNVTTLDASIDALIEMGVPTHESSARTPEKPRHKNHRISTQRGATPFIIGLTGIAILSLAAFFFQVNPPMFADIVEQFSTETAADGSDTSVPDPEFRNVDDTITLLQSLNFQDIHVYKDLSLRHNIRQDFISAGFSPSEIRDLYCVFDSGARDYYELTITESCDARLRSKDDYLSSDDEYKTRNEGLSICSEFHDTCQHYSIEVTIAPY